MRAKVLLPSSGSLAFAFVFACLWQCVSSDTFNVTSSLCTGPGSFTNALELANANPGPDIIEFVGVSTVNAQRCPPAYPPPSVFVAAAYGYVNDSVEIKGNGVKMAGAQAFVTSGGLVTPLDRDCPNRALSTDIIVFRTLGFLWIEGPNVNVTVRDMTIFEHEFIIKTVDGCDNCRIVLNGMKAERILPIVSCTSIAIELGTGSNMYLEIVNNQWDTIWNYADIIAVPPFYIYSGAIGSRSDATLYIDHSSFNLFGAEYAFLVWKGKVDIVSSLVVRAGGMSINSAQDSNIVNTAWFSSAFDEPSPEDRIYNRGSGDLNFISSTLYYGLLECRTNCQRMGYPGAIMPWPSAGNINFKWTAIGINLPDFPPTSPLLDNRFGAFSADALSWMQPSANQSAQALKNVTSQPSLLTDPRGLSVYAATDYRSFLTPLIGNQTTPGVLIDAILDANSTNKLINPVTGAEIQKDVFGNPRNDGDRRDIGAVQVGDAVVLSIEPNNTCAILSWNQPSAPVGDSVAGYSVTYTPLPSGSPTVVNVTDATTTITTICNLTEGIQYGFNVKPYYTSGGVGPPSNTVTVTAYGPFLPPTIFPSATPTATTISTNWTQPSLGGRQLLAYAYIYYPKDLSKPAQVVQTGPGTNTATITGLMPSTMYTICIAAEATNANSVTGSESVTGNCIDISTGPPCTDLGAKIKARRRVRAGSKFSAVITLRRPKAVKHVEGVGFDVTWPAGLAVLDTRFVRRWSKYGTVNVTSSGATVTNVALRTRKLRFKLRLRVNSCGTPTFALGLETFQKISEPYGFLYCAQDLSWVISCK